MMNFGSRRKRNPNWFTHLHHNDFAFVSRFLVLFGGLPCGIVTNPVTLADFETFEPLVLELLANQDTNFAGVVGNDKTKEFSCSCGTRSCPHVAFVFSFGIEFRNTDQSMAMLQCL